MGKNLGRKDTDLFSATIFAFFVLLLFVFSVNVGERITTGMAPHAQYENLELLSPTGECKDSDGGRDYFDKGSVVFSSIVKTDYCLSHSTLVEYYCHNGIESEYRVCENRCLDGRCV